MAMNFLDRADRSYPRVLWCIRVDGRGVKDPVHRCKQASAIEKTLVEGEEEFLYATFSAFRVEETNWTESIYQIVLSAALDNLSDLKNLPLAPWY